MSTQDTIRMDIVEVDGRKFEDVKIMGMLPESADPDEFNLYVRWHADGTVSVDRSDTDKTIVRYTTRNGKLAAFGTLMTLLANVYGLPVVVEADYGVSGGMVSKLCGRWEPEADKAVAYGHAAPVAEDIPAETIMDGKHAYGRSAMVCGVAMEGDGTSCMARVTCEPCRQGVFGRLRAASGELITDGMPVWDYNLNVGTVDLSTLTSDGWFNVNSPTGERMSLMNGERVASRHPVNRMLARDALSALVNVAGEVQRRETARAIAVEEANPVEGDWIYRERDGATGRVVNVNQHGRLAVDWLNGCHTSQHWDALQSDGYERITAAEYAGLVAAYTPAPVSSEVPTVLPVRTPGAALLVKPSLRANVNRRKRKATRVGRKRNRGGK